MDAARDGARRRRRRVASGWRAVPAQVAGAARTAVVRPSVALTADHRQVILSGVWIRAVPADTIFQNGFEL